MLALNANRFRILVTKTAKSVTSIPMLSPTHFVSNSYYRHRCYNLVILIHKNLLNSCGYLTAVFSESNLFKSKICGLQFFVWVEILAPYRFRELIAIDIWRPLIFEISQSDSRIFQPIRWKNYLYRVAPFFLGSIATDNKVDKAGNSKSSERIRNWKITLTLLRTKIVNRKWFIFTGSEEDKSQTTSSTKKWKRPMVIFERWSPWWSLSRF